MNDSRRLLKALIMEVVIAGEVETDPLYAKYRPDDAKEFLGMIMKTDDGSDDADGSSGTIENDGSMDDTDPAKGPTIDVDLSPDDTAEESDEE